jgi:acyl-CoA thioesterase-1
MEKKILIVGDSLSKGVILDEEKKKYTLLKECFFSLISESVNAQLINASKFGSTVAQGQKQLESKMEKYDPDIVVIEFGGNDCDFRWDDIANDPMQDHIPNTPLDIFEESINHMLDYVQQSGKTPVLTTLPPIYADSYFKWFTNCDREKGLRILKWLKDVWRIYWWQERYSNCIEYIARIRNIACIDIRRAFLKGREFANYICSDGIHPNREGHQLIFETVMSFIKENASYLLSVKA